MILKPEKDHEFPINTPQGQRIIKVPPSDMRACSCGCEMFEKKYKVTWWKPPGVLNAPTLCLQVECFVCPTCGKEVTPANPSVGEIRLAAS